MLSGQHVPRAMKGSPRKVLLQNNQSLIKLSKPLGHMWAKLEGRIIFPLSFPSFSPSSPLPFADRRHDFGTKRFRRNSVLGRVPVDSRVRFAPVFFSPSC